MIIFGIDPGTQFAGYGVISKKGEQLAYCDHGVITIPAQLAFAAKLAYLYKELKPLWQKWQPQVVSIEKVFLGRNVDSVFKLGHARGVCLMMAAEAGSEVAEYAARSVKKILTGSGAAEKSQVQIMVEQILNKKIVGRFDATDALALAICHALDSERQVILSRLEVL